MNLVPIILFVYNRPEHTKKTVDSLQRNNLARDSSLFIFSDGPRKGSDQKKINEVRSFIHKIDGFKSIEIEESKINKGLANSVIEGVTKVLKKFHKAIILEDDIVCSSDYLTYMNEALNKYVNNNRIFSISGYSFPINIPAEYDGDVYVLPRASTWGWGTWIDRWERVDWNVTDYDKFIQNKLAQRRFNQGGEDLTPMLTSQMQGVIDSWGIRWAYAHYKNNSFCLYPVKSKVKNIGADKSGIHTPRTEKFNVFLENSSVQTDFIKEPVLNVKIQQNLKKFMKLSVQRKIINFVKYTFRYK